MRIIPNITVTICVAALPILAAASSTEFNHCVPVDFRYTQTDLDDFRRDFDRSVFQIRATTGQASEGAAVDRTEMPPGINNSSLDAPLGAPDALTGRLLEDLGTGFLVADNLALTAMHVVTTDEGAKHADIDVYFPRIDPSGGTGTVIDVNPELDVAIIEITRESTEKLPGLPIRVKPFSEHSPGIFTFSYARKQFRNNNGPTPEEGKIVSGPLGHTMDYDSHKGDSGAPVVHEATGHVIGVHTGKLDGYNERTVTMTEDIVDWIIDAIPDDRLDLHISEFFDDDQPVLARKLKPTTCNPSTPCWENVEIAKVVRMLVHKHKNNIDLPADKLKCPLWDAASSRSLDPSMVALDILLDRRRENGSPTDALINEAIARVRSDFSEIMNEHDRMALQDRERFMLRNIQDLRRSEAHLVDRAISQMLEDWGRVAGRFCAPLSAQKLTAPATASDAFNAPRQAMRRAGAQMAALSHVARLAIIADSTNRLSALTGLERSAPVCNDTYRNQRIEKRLRDAALAVALRLQLELTLETPVVDDSMARQVLYYLFAAVFAPEDRDRHLAYQDVASLAIRKAPHVAAYSALLAYLEGFSKRRDADDYNFAVTLAGRDRIERLGLPTRIEPGNQVVLSDAFIRRELYEAVFGLFLR